MKFFKILLLTLFVAGCNSAYKSKVGKGPITLSPDAQASFDKYLKSNPSVFAITEDGYTSWGYYYCREFNGCRGHRTQSMGPAIKACQERSNGKPCKVYAIGQSIVWESDGTKDPSSVSTAKNDPLIQTKQSCKNGDLEDCATAYKTYYKKHRSLINDVKAINRNNINAYSNNEAKAVQACIDGSAKNCMSLGNKYFQIHTNISRAQKAEKVQLLTDQCHSGEAKSCNELGHLYNDKERNPKAAISFYKEGCDSGNAESCFELGSIYRHARGEISQDNEKAYKLLKRACDKNSAKGCKLLGDMYKTGIFVKQSNEESNRLYKKSDALL